MLPSRHIELPGCFNLRDLGGYRTRSGAVVGWHQLYRSGEFSRVSPGVAGHLVHDLGIRRVIDLRTAEEIGGVRCPLPEPCRPVSVPLFTTFRPHWVRPSDQRPQATASRYLEMLEQGLPAIGRIVSLLVETPWRTTLVHCAAGRDRTGIVIAFLLDLLEVPEDVIAVDYALSDGVIEDGGRARAETIHHLLELLREQHDSSRDMLVRSGVASAHIDQLRDLLLENVSGA